MPKIHEKERKIKLLKSGKNVRPPKAWWIKMMPLIRNQYPDYDDKEQYQVLGGIWNSYNIKSKINIINEYQENLKLDDTRTIEHRDILGRMI